jgi:hypothetical protein
MKADHGGRVVKGMNCLLSIERWDRGFESHSKLLLSVCSFNMSLCCPVCR